MKTQKLDHMQNPSNSSNKILIAALYHFVRQPLANLQAMKQSLLTESDPSIRGTLLFASEGVNGTIAGSPEAINSCLQTLSNWLGEELNWKASTAKTNPFLRFKVKIKSEIVTMGKGAIDVVNQTAEHVDVQTWHDLLNDPDTVVIDTRNDYEIALGQFKHATSPNTTNFREFPSYVDKHKKSWQGKKVAMYCTGGIRCEKASAYVKSVGIDQVYQLDGGILKYLEAVKPEESQWQGECFVFDNRVSVDHQIQPTGRGQCFGCRWPLEHGDEQSDRYEAGVSCPRCYDLTTDNQKKRFKQRQRQIALANKRGQTHLGSINTIKTDERHRSDDKNTRI